LLSNFDNVFSINHFLKMLNKSLNDLNLVFYLTKYIKKKHKVLKFKLNFKN
jgi:hypothetical protein